MEEFLLIIKGKEALDNAQDVVEQRIEEYNKWVTTIEDHHISANRLENHGAHLKAKGQIQTDGPFLEAKEIIAGYVMIRAQNLQQAITIADSCPLLNYFEIMVRPIVKR